MKKTGTLKNCKKENLIFLIVVLTGAILRFAGLNWGITSIFHPDEDMPNIVHYMIDNRTFLHSFWTYPCQCSSKVLAVLLFVASKVYNLRDIDYFFICRGYVALLSTVSIVLTYYICKKIRGYRFALCSSFAVAIYPVYVVYAKQVVLDTIVLFWGLLVVLISLYYMDERKWQQLVMMSVFAGCATTEKWSGGCLCIFIAIIVIRTHWLRWDEIVKKGLTAIAAYVITIIAIIPNILGNISEISTELSRLQDDNGFGITTIPGYLAPFFCCGGVIALVLLIGGIVTVYTDHNKYHIVYSFGLIWLISLWILTGYTPVRWGMSIYWVMLVLICEFVTKRKEKKDRNSGLLVIIATLLFFLTFFTESIYYVVVATHSDQDTRIICEAEFEELGVNVDNSLSDPYTTLRPGKMREGGTSKLWNGEDDIIFMNEDDLYIAEPDIKYIVTGSYGRNTDSAANHIIREYGREIYRIDSDFPSMDIFHNDGNPHGSYNKFELDVIKQSFLDMNKILKGASMGPSMVVYDVSGFDYKEPVEE